MKPKFNNYYTPLQQSVINRLAEIEQEDADTCAGCGGEDCICCEIYHDRMKWKSPEELFDDDYDPADGWHDDNNDDEELLCSVCGEFIDDDDEAWECNCGNIIHKCCANRDGECDECEMKHKRYSSPLENPFKD